MMAQAEAVFLPLSRTIQGLARISHEGKQVLLPQSIFLTQETAPMLTECNSLDFASLGSRKVTAAFDGGAMTSNAGAPLLRETDRIIGLSRQAAACFTDGRRSRGRG